MINQGQLLYRELQEFRGAPLIFPIGIQVTAPGEHLFGCQKIWSVLETVEEEFTKIPVKCYRMRIEPHTLKLCGIIVCFREQDVAYAMKFKLGLSNDI